MDAKQQQVLRSAYLAALRAGDTENAAKFKAGMTKMVAEMPLYEKVIGGAAVGLDNMIRGAAQRVGEVVPRGVSEALELEPGKGDVKNRRRVNSALMNTLPGTLGSWVPEIALTGPGMGMKAAIRAGSSMGLLSPTAEDENPLVNAGLGAVGAAAGEGATKMLAAPLKSALNPVQKALARKAESLGISLDSAQKSGNRTLNYIDSALGDMPLTAGAQKLKNETQRNQVNRAVARSFGADTSELTSELFKHHQGVIGSEMNDIAGRTAIALNDELINGLVNTVKQISDESIDPAKLKLVKNMVRELLLAQKDGAIPGTIYRKFNTKLARIIETRSKSGDGDLVHDLGRLKEIVDDAAAKSMDPEDLSRFGELRGRYSNLKTAERSYNETSGELVLSRLRNQINKGKGQQDLGDIAKISDAFLRPPQNSGTAPRNQIMSWLGNPLTAAGGYALDPMAGIGLGLGAVTSVGLRNLMDPSTKTNAIGQILKSKYPSQALSRIGAAGALTDD
jgi:hypothetical protein